MAFGLMCLLGYWYLYPYKIITAKEPLVIGTKQVKPGDELDITIDYCKYYDLPADVTVHYSDGVVYSRPTFTTRNQAGCHISKPEETVPKLPNSNYTVTMIYRYHPNPIRTIIYSFESEPFTITSQK